MTGKRENGKTRKRDKSEGMDKVISRTPLRISFVGGGTDLLWFYENHGGAAISTAIDKYVTVEVREDGKTGKREDENPIVRECLRVTGVKGVSIEIESDVCSQGTGLGSSSALTVGLLNALSVYKRKKAGHDFGMMPDEYLARKACEVELDVLGKPIGKQDAYASAYGGFRRYSFKRDGSVDVSGHLIFHFPLHQLQRDLMLFDTHIQRSADTILESQRERNDIATLLKIKALEEQFYNCKIDDVGGILHEGWMLKRELSELTTTAALDEIYRRALDAGAVGGKLLGAGGGGHFLFYVRPDAQESVKDALEGLATHVAFRFESEGTHLV